MPIQFHCPHCDQLLTTGDEKAGRQAKCPQCSMPLLVPQASTAEPVPEVEDELADAWPATSAASATFAVAPPIAVTRSCPACGQPNDAAAANCTACGERLPVPPGRAASEVDIGTILSASWEVYQANLGLCIGSFFLDVLLGGAAIALVAGVAAASIAVLGGQGQPPEALAGVVVAFGLVAAFYIWGHLHAGQSLFHLKLARSEDARFGELLAGGPFAARMSVNMLVFTLITFLGYLLCFVPGVLLTLMYWPFAYVLVDEDAPGLNALGRARQVTRGNWLTAILLWCVAFGLQFVGTVTFYIGLIFTTPFIALMFAVAYDHMARAAANDVPTED